MGGPGARAGLDVRVIHLVRDVRGVASSLGKRHVAQPHAVREAGVMSHYGPPAAAARPPGHIGDGRVVLGASHGLSGNPSRFSDGGITLRADENWRTGMSGRDRLVVTAIGLPMLLRYARAPAGTAQRTGPHD